MPFCNCRPPRPNTSDTSLKLVKTNTNNNTLPHQPDWERTEFKGTEVFEFHDPQRLIEVAAAGVCAVCSIVVNGLDVVQQGWAGEAGFVVVRKPVGRPHEVIGIGGGLDLSVRLFVPHDFLPTKGFSKLQSVTVSEDAVDDPSSKILRSWLDRCLKDHSSTCGKLLPRQMPQRLIDVARNPSNSDVGLCETDGKPKKYTALSHCWGGEQPIKLCKRSLKPMKKRIAWSTLPKNFQDAINVTRELGIRWIWIDTLCIIQDDISDWQRESAKMANIYEGAHLTLIAASSSNSHESFLRPRRSGKPIPNSGVWVRKKHSHEKLETLPLYSRGWAYQERLLSTRMVIFGTEEIYWECKSDQLCECGAQDGKICARPLKRRWKPSASFDWQSIERHDYWHDTVAEYTRCALSFSKDKLPALSGIASRSKSHLSDIYLAGLWKDRLIRDLCWQQDDDSKRTLPALYRAPTWSWASIEARITNQFEMFCDEDFQALAPVMRIDDAVCSPIGENPFGEVKDGYILVTAPTITVKLQSESKPPVPGTENGFSVCIPGCTSPNYFWPDVHLRYLSSVVTDNTILRCDEEVRPAWKNLDVPLRCVLIIQGESKKEGVNMKTASKCIWALVLGKPRTGNGVYERLGILTTFRKSGTEVWGNGFKWFDDAPVETSKIV